jgi:SepF-like predicted cell division protein (DUF552 family)
MTIADLGNLPGMCGDTHQLNKVIEKLKQTRDEIKLKMHLGAADTKDEFEKAQKKLDKLTEDLKPLRDEVEQSSQNILESMSLVGEEIGDSFKRIQNLLIPKK